ncbi:unnamed protein product [Acanthoscelides obtectus]|uniref:Odorant receptor n=1 Tax=Acanthoscelides obtectus TaxID=200917 RepID=A0A9P0PVL4_ACAOB|nr:unnamed protein product [Acanthoscelides obtectus]CAK1635805.1 hypothetical protein AOBTE_LOCUS9521 [Acanthoscelides obtectus]
MHLFLIDHCLRLMNVLGVHPAKSGEKMQTVRYVFFLAHHVALMYLVLWLAEAKGRDMSLLEQIDIFTNFLAQLHAILNLLCLYTQRPKIMALLKDMDERFWRVDSYDHQPELKQAYLVLFNKARVKYIIYMTMMISCCVSYHYGRLVKDGRHIDNNLPFKSYLPGWMPFWVLFAWQHIASFGLVSTEIAMDVMIYSILSLTALQFKLLQHEMENIFSLENDKKCEVMDLLKKRIKRCDDHHTLLLNFRTELNDAFSGLLLVYLEVITVILCIELYFLSILDDLEDIIRALVYGALMFFTLTS